MPFGIHRVFWIMALAACAPAQSPIAPPATSPETAETGAPSVAAPEAPADAAAPPTDDKADPLPAECRATPQAPLDLAAAIRAKACVVEPGDGGEARPLPDSVTLRVESESPSVGSGRYVVLRILVSNAGTEDAELWIERMPDVSGAFRGEIESAFGDFGHDSSTGKKSNGKPAPPPEPPPSAHTTKGFSVTAAFDSKNRSTAFPVQSYGMIGLLSSRIDYVLTRVVLPPSTAAHATLVWKATGYDPNKNYVPKHSGNEGFMIPPPEKLEPGKYRLEIATPFQRADGSAVGVSTAVTVTR